MKRRELRIVVKHLLEVGNGPEAIGRVAMVPAPEMVANAAACHPVECEQHHPQRIGRSVFASPSQRRIDG